MAVGYGGIRIRSTDLGHTWAQTGVLSSNGGDDQNLIRGVAYGNGRWVAAGYPLVTSDDNGATWATHTLPNNMSGTPVEGVAFANGKFWASMCSSLDIYSSTDGVTWTHASTTPQTGSGGSNHTSIFAVGNTLYISGDSGSSYSSTDGVTWTSLSGVSHAAYCDGQVKSASQCPAYWVEGGIWLKADWGAPIQRSTDHVTWSNVFTIPMGNNWYKFGYSAVP
jgi:hypothetical protein